MSNGYFDLLEMEGIKPKKIFQQDSLGDFDYTQKISYGEKYQPDLLPRIAEDNKKAKITQNKKKQKEDSEYFNKVLIFKQACEALNETTFIVDGQELKAIDYFKEHCIYKVIREVKKNMNMEATHALVVRWVEFYLLSVIGEFDSLLELKTPTPNIPVEPILNA